MKTAIIQGNEQLQRLVDFTRQFSNTVEVQSFEELQKDKKIEVIVTAQRNIAHSDLIQIRNMFQKQKIVIVAEKIDPLFARTCTAHDILLLSNEWTEREQLNTIQKVWFGLEEQTEYHNVIALHGTHRQVGLSQLVLSIGHTLGTFNYKTVVIGLNPYNPGEVENHKATYSFDQVYDLIQTNVIHDGESLMPYLEKNEHFSYLPGNRDFYKAMSFEAKPVERLIDFAKEKFDIVLLDVGSFYDSYLPLTGLQLSNIHILVSSQDQISTEEYKRWKEQILNRFEFFPKSVYQVVNKYASKAIITLKQLEDTHDIPILAQVPFFPEANDAVIEDGILALSGYNSYNRAIEGISKAIGAEVLASANNSKEQKGILGFFRKGKS